MTILARVATNHFRGARMIPLNPAEPTNELSDRISLVVQCHEGGRRWSITEISAEEPAVVHAPMTRPERQRWRDGEAERRRRPEVENEVELDGAPRRGGGQRWRAAIRTPRGREDAGRGAECSDRRGPYVVLSTPAESRKPAISVRELRDVRRVCRRRTVRPVRMTRRER